MHLSFHFLHICSSILNLELKYLKGFANKCLFHKNIWCWDVTQITSVIIIFLSWSNPLVFDYVWIHTGWYMFKYVNVTYNILVLLTTAKLLCDPPLISQHCSNVSTKAGNVNIRWLSANIDSCATVNQAHLKWNSQICILNMIIIGLKGE